LLELLDEIHVFLVVIVFALHKGPRWLRVGERPSYGAAKQRINSAL